ncbi:sugar nucleotide-binding protein [Neoroseomonas lacus]|uniref:RmlD-like substrate binding domain-containing protein n=1 Tax=Neoroseomonas lacus TaxID=287609 RepID=A0A917L726_9PROT|nr:sugar nucleotide-binding protein [Neoroseomonas lacus]GGJ45554.1 hypothetical protein GCM10011320_61180 [Neoroseomonas lacus]
MRRIAPMCKNFVRTMLRVGVERNELRIVANQHGSPTAAPDPAAAIAAILARIRAEGWQDREQDLTCAIRALHAV